MLISLVLGLCTFSIFWPVIYHDFVNYDDRLYVTENPTVQQGLTLEGAAWAFGTTHASNWHPMVWFSHMADCSMFGLFPGGHHLISMLFHVANTVLLFLLLKRLTGAVWRSGLVAALFALHPLHVESVAWVAERKDVLSTLFWILTVWAYLRYVERPGPGRYWLTVLALALGLMTKPMLVTLPCVLLLLDFWPLGRLGFENCAPASLFQPSRRDLPAVCPQPGVETPGYSRFIPPGQKWVNSRPFRLIVEKVPFFTLSAASCMVTVWAQHSGGALKSLDVVPLPIRMANAILAYGAYLWKTIWPADLAVLYPLPDQAPILRAVVSGFVLLGVSVFVWRARRLHPALIVGWLWYLLTLIPVIGLIQVGAQAMADRYTYVPLIGIFIGVVWGFADWTSTREPLRRMSLAVAGVALTACALVTANQLQYWQDGTTLFRHAARVTKDNYIAHNNLGTALSTQGHTAEAIAEYTKALRINPNYATAHFNLSTDLANEGQSTQAMAHLNQVLRLRPREAEAHNNLGVILAQQGQLDKAMSHFATAIRLKPEYLKPHLNLAAAYAEAGRFPEAVRIGSNALQVASATGQKELAIEIGHRLQFYSAGKPYHELP